MHHRIGNTGSANPTAKSVSPSNKGFPHFGLPQFLKTNFHISVTDEASAFKIGKALGLPKPIIKSHAEEKWAWPWARVAPQNFGVPLNIFVTAEASDFKFGMQLGFAKSHHKITQMI